MPLVQTKSVRYAGVMRTLLTAIVCLVPLAGCRGPQPVAQAPEVKLSPVPMLVGSFSSAAQAKADPQNFLDIRLEMVEIWPERTDGAWLYVEQAAATALARPYRQRIYRVREIGPGVWESAVFSLPGNALSWAGLWRTPEAFDALTPSDLIERAGCAITLRLDPDGSRFEGSTTGTGCASSIAGASYATSEVVLEAGRLTTWDRGYASEGEQVWGSEAGPYVFDRLRSDPVYARSAEGSYGS